MLCLVRNPVKKSLLKDPFMQGLGTISTHSLGECQILVIRF